MTWRSVRRYCRFCGRTFMTKNNINMVFCSRTCQQKQWRAVAMLAGTHGWAADGQFRRLT